MRNSSDESPSSRSRHHHQYKSKSKHNIFKFNYRDLRFSIFIINYIKSI